MKRIEVRAETQARVWQIRCARGERVAAGQEIVILESMKMEIPLESPVAGVVCELRVVEGSPVKEGDVVAVVDPD
jgi:acetyl-CoA carboxylase biotin carboxyl carrier protein